jgi:hypothetical protein
MEDAMRTLRLHPLLPPLLALCSGLLGACASHEAKDIAMEGRYEASLARWKGAPEGALLAGWGPPVAAENLPDGRMLVYVTRTDIVNQSAPQGYHTITAFGAPMYVQAMTAAPIVPATCRTTFVLHQGVVTSWTFDGIGCGSRH